MKGGAVEAVGWSNSIDSMKKRTASPFRYWSSTVCASSHKSALTLCFKRLVRFFSSLGNHEVSIPSALSCKYSPLWTEWSFGISCARFPGSFAMSCLHRFRESLFIAMVLHPRSPFPHFFCFMVLAPRHRILISGVLGINRRRL